MTTRSIKVLSTVGQTGTIETNVTTVAELKPLLTEKGFNFSGMKMMVGETRNELSLDESVLPDTDFKLYLMPAKTKSGSSSDIMERIAEAHKDIAELYEELAKDLEKDNSLAARAVKEDPDMADLLALSQEMNFEDEDCDEDY